MHTGARLYKIASLENKATCKVMNLIKINWRTATLTDLYPTTSLLVVFVAAVAVL